MYADFNLNIFCIFPGKMSLQLVRDEIEAWQEAQRHVHVRMYLTRVIFVHAYTSAYMYVCTAHTAFFTWVYR